MNQNIRKIAMISLCVGLSVPMGVDACTNAKYKCHATHDGKSSTDACDGTTNPTFTVECTESETTVACVMKNDSDYYFDQNCTAVKIYFESDGSCIPATDIKAEVAGCAF